MSKGGDNVKVQFQGIGDVYSCSEPVEQKIFCQGIATGWAIMFHIYGNIDSSNMDNILTEESIRKLSFDNEDETGFSINGYTAITSCVIRHRGAATVAEIQLAKTSESDTRKGDTNNG